MRKSRLSETQIVEILKDTARLQHPKVFGAKRFVSSGVHQMLKKVAQV